MCLLLVPFTDLGLYNCALVIHKGELVSIMPKTMIPNYGEYYEGRYFDSLDVGKDVQNGIICRIGCHQGVLTPLIIQLHAEDKSFLCSFTIEICEDMWTPFNPSMQSLAHGAELVLNLSTSNSIYGKGKYRNELISAYTIKNCCSYVYCSSGFGESSNDLIWDGSVIVYQDGEQILNTSALTPCSSEYHETVLDLPN